MFAIKLWNFLKGYAIIKVEGLGIEKFLNLIITNNIYVWEVIRISNTAILAKISLRGFKEIQPYVKITKCRVNILAKKGLPFLILNLKKRKMLVLSALVCLILIYIFSTFIWTIEIRGIENNNLIAKQLKELGLKPGISKYNLDIHKIESQFLLNNNNISWIGINIKGTKALVKIVEKTKTKNPVEEDLPCNIIAKKDGLIQKITVLYGVAVKKPGDTVKAGDLIISGIIEKPNLETRFVKAKGEVIARTWYESYADIPLEKKEFVRTGNYLVVYNISIGNNNISISSKKNNFKHYDKISKVITNKYLPFVIYKDFYYETKQQIIKLTENEAENSALQLAMENINNFMSKEAEIINKKENVIILDGKIARANIILEVLENIGIEEKINYNEEVNIDQRNNN